MLTCAFNWKQKMFRTEGTGSGLLHYCLVEQFLSTGEQLLLYEDPQEKGKLCRRIADLREQHCFLMVAFCKKQHQTKVWQFLTRQTGSQGALKAHRGQPNTFCSAFKENWFNTSITYSSFPSCCSSFSVRAKSLFHKDYVVESSPNTGSSLM